MREFRTSGSVRGALSNERPYRDYANPVVPMSSSMTPGDGRVFAPITPYRFRSEASWVISSAVRKAVAEAL